MMNNKFRKIISVLLIIIIILPCFSTVVFAGMRDELQPKPPSTPSEPPSNGGGSDSPVDPPSPPSIIVPPGETDVPENDIDDGEEREEYRTEYRTVEKYVYTEIRGNVWEDLCSPSLQSESEDLYKTKVLSPNGIRDSFEKGISYILVELISETGEILDYTFTDSDGNYNLEPLPGTYSLRFTFGKPVLSRSDDWLYESEFKYNGQDYTGKFVTDISENIANEQFKRIVELKGKGFSQVFIVIDFSGSMYDEYTKDGKTRIKSIKESAIELVKYLFEIGDDRLAVGFIAFSGEAARICSLTNIPEEVINAIAGFDTIQATYLDGTTVENRIWGSLNTTMTGTNISSGVLKAQASFLNKNIDTSNRNIILFTDGAPTAHNNCEEVYSDDSDYDFEVKINNIANATRNDLYNVVNNGINLISVLTETDDEIEQEISSKTFSGIGKYYSISDTSTAIHDVLTKNVVEDIVENIEEEGTIITGEELYKYYSDDPTRRHISDEYFKSMNNSKLSILSKIDKAVDLREAYDLLQSAEELLEFLNNTYITVNSDRSYVIEEFPDPSTVVTTSESTTTQGKLTIHTTTITTTKYIRVAYENQNLCLFRRDEFALDLNILVTGLRVTLSDGTILHQNISYDNTNISLVTNNIFSYSENDVPGLYIVVMDEDIMHGATVEIEYTFDIQNISAITATQFSLIDYLENTPLVYNENSKLLSNPSLTNKDFHWQELSIEELKNTGYIDKDLQFTKNTGLRLDKQLFDPSTGVDINNTFIGPNGHRYIKLVLSLVISTDFDIEFDYLNCAEIINYSNVIGRRPELISNKEELFDGTENIPVYDHIIPGNYTPLYLNENFEIDTSLSMLVEVIVPLGTPQKTSHSFVPLMAGLISINTIDIDKAKKLFNNKK